jgi:hypothetical protein
MSSAFLATAVAMSSCDCAIGGTELDSACVSSACALSCALSSAAPIAVARSLGW